MPLLQEIWAENRSITKALIASPCVVLIAWLGNYVVEQTTNQVLPLDTAAASMIKGINDFFGICILIISGLVALEQLWSGWRYKHYPMQRNSTTDTRTNAEPEGRPYYDAAFPDWRTSIDSKPNRHRLSLLERFKSVLSRDTTALPLICSFLIIPLALAALFDWKSFTLVSCLLAAMVMSGYCGLFYVASRRIRQWVLKA